MHDLINTMKIFLDTADTQAIKDGYETGLIDGVTTNPSLILKNGGDPEVVYQSLIELGIPDISMEVVGNTETQPPTPKFFEEYIMEVTIYDELRTMKIFLDTADTEAIKKDMKLDW